MRVLITNIVLDSRTGTEVVAIELATALARRGHEVAVFSPDIGESGRKLMAEGIRVLSSVPDPEFRPDVIHGHHNVPLVQALIAYPCVPALFVCHDAVQWTDSPPLLSRIRKYVAVSRMLLGRLHKELPGIGERALIVHNAVDLDKFKQRDRLPSRPGNALVGAKHAAPLEAIREACRQHKLRLDVIGPGVGNVSEELHRIFPQYDLVFATGRSAIEALAVGSAVILADGRGCGGLVTSENMRDYREFNFGLGILKSPTTASRLAEAIGRYDADDAFAVSCFIRENNGLDRATSIYEALYADLLKDGQAVSPDEEAAELSRLLADWLPGLDRFPAATSLSRTGLIEYQALLREHEALLNSRSRLFRALVKAVKRKFRRGSGGQAGSRKSISRLLG